MSRLVPCPHCSRHVRADSDVCPFCEGFLDPSSLASRVAPRAVHSAGVKRATLFALGATMAAACNENVTAIYGAPISPSDWPTIPDAATPLTEGSSASAVSSGAASSDGEGSESTTEDLAMPEYGAPVPPPSASDVPSPPPKDAGASDAGAGDAGLLDADLTFSVPPDEPDPAPQPIPLYGAPPSL